MGREAPRRHQFTKRTELPTNANYRWRAHHSSAILNGVLYIDGGEVSQFGEGVPGRESQEVNSTISIGLDWGISTEGTTVSVIPRVAPNTKHAAFIPDHRRDVIYTWGGQGSFGNATGGQDPRLWEFSPSHGQNMWRALPAAKDKDGKDIYRTYGAAATECGGKLYFLGGASSNAVDFRLVADRLQGSGLVIYDPATSQWRNVTVPERYRAPFIGGQLACLPYGPAGALLAVLGGAGSTSLAEDDLMARRVQHDFQRLWFYETSTGKWHSQTTVGVPPGPLEFFCAPGVKSTNNTYEIYIYGGYNNNQHRQEVDMGSKNVWILSIPAFKWFLTKAEGTPRYMHTCHIHGGKLISIGGRAGWSTEWGNATTPPSTVRDPWPGGLRGLDLNQLKWEENIGSYYGVYDAPQEVREFNVAGSWLRDLKWSSDEFMSLFLNRTSSYGGSGSGAIAPETSSPGSFRSPDKPAESQMAGYIAGGVAGGVIALCLILYLVVRRRQDKRAAAVKTEPPPAYTP